MGCFLPNAVSPLRQEEGTQVCQPQGKGVKPVTAELNILLSGRFHALTNHSFH